MTLSNVVEVVLLTFGVGAELLAVAGLLVFRDSFDRLHALAAAGVAGPVLLVAAVVLHEGMSGIAVRAIASGALILLTGPLLIHATARLLRVHEAGDPAASAEERT